MFGRSTPARDGSGSPVRAVPCVNGSARATSGSYARTREHAAPQGNYKRTARKAGRQIKIFYTHQLVFCLPYSVYIPHLNQQGRGLLFGKKR